MWYPMKILMLYHSSIFEKRPGADEHVYTTAKLLSESNIITVVTWGEGRYKILRDGNLTITHIGKGARHFSNDHLNKLPRFMMDVISYLGIYYLVFLKNSGPSVSEFIRMENGKFDVVIRVSFDNNGIPRYFRTHVGVPVVELAIVSGLPHYLSNVKNWVRYCGSASPLSLSSIRFLHGIFQKIVLWFYVSSLASENVMVISDHDRRELQKIRRLKVYYTPPILNFTCEELHITDSRIALFFSGRSMSAQIAYEYIMAAAEKLIDVQFAITGYHSSIRNILFYQTTI